MLSAAYNPSRPDLERQELQVPTAPTVISWTCTVPSQAKAANLGCSREHASDTTKVLQ